MAEQKINTIGNLIKERLQDESPMQDKFDVNSIYNRKRKDLAEKVIALFNKNGYVFGGYLRDEIADTRFTDVDIFFPSINAGYDRVNDYTVIEQLKRAGFTIVDLGEKKTYIDSKEIIDQDGKKRKRGFRNHLVVRQLEVEDRSVGITVRFDMVFSSILREVNRDFPFVVGLDADINCLWRGKNGQLCLAPNMEKKTTLEEVKKNILNKVFAPMNTEMREGRLNKLISKGYKPIDKAAAKVSTVCKENDQKESNMSTPNTNMSKDYQSFGDQFKNEMIQGIYQATGSELAEGVRSGILTVAKHYGADDGAVAGLTKFLDSPAGKAAIEAGLGHALPYAPMIGDNEHVEKIAEKMRVNGYAQGMQLLFGIMMQFILPNISKTLANLDEKIAAANNMTQMLGKGKTKARIAKDAEHETEAEAETVVEEESTSQARKKAA